MAKSVVVLAVLALAAGTAHAEELSCKGNIISVQGEGLVARTHRFEVSEVTGGDVMAVLAKCRDIAKERQNRAARKNPALRFRAVSEVRLECVKDGEKLQVQRTIQTGS